ncbi:hypothetical protein PG988_007424 [Apiospora saccharicola]
MGVLSLSSQASCASTPWKTRAQSRLSCSRICCVAGGADPCQKVLIISLFQDAGSLAFAVEVLRSLQRELENEVGRLEVVTAKEILGIRKILGVFEIDEV